MAVVLVLLGGPPHPRPVQLRTSFVPGSRVRPEMASVLSAHVYVPGAVLGRLWNSLVKSKRQNKQVSRESGQIRAQSKGSL